MTLDDVRDYERNMHEKTNIKVVNYHEQQEHSTSKPSSLGDIEIHDKPSVCPFSLSLFHHISFFWCLWMKYRVRIHPLILSHTETTATEDRRSERMMRSRLFCAYFPARKFRVSNSKWMFVDDEPANEAEAPQQSLWVQLPYKSPSHHYPDLKTFSRSLRCNRKAIHTDYALRKYKNKDDHVMQGVKKKKKNLLFT